MAVPVAASIRALAGELGAEAFTAVCVDLLRGAPRERYAAELRAPSGHAEHDPEAWKDHWVRSWGARGLLTRGTTPPPRRSSPEPHRSSRRSIAWARTRASSWAARRAAPSPRVSP